jgi:uncharacterized FlaG/YvyC family protein
MGIEKTNNRENLNSFNYESYYSHKNLDKERVKETVKILNEALSKLKKNRNFNTRY